MKVLLLIAGVSGALAVSGEAIVCGPAARASFTEGAPVDVFRIRNMSLPGWRIDRVEIGLAGSVGRLVFDTAPGGPGRNVSQPFRALGGPAKLSSQPQVPDGSERLLLAFDSFPEGMDFEFTIDMDDRISGYAGTSVSGSEVQGAAITVTFVDETGAKAEHVGLFDTAGQAFAAAACLS
ncbi:MAG: hypothetical protein ACFBRM_03120 [Pikeienuella sp.]